MACFLVYDGFAQTNYTFKEKRADHLFETNSFHKAIKVYHKVIEKRPANDRAKLKLAESYFKSNDTESAETWYAQVINKSYLVKSIHYLHYAQVLQSNGKFNTSLRWAKKYLGANPKSEVAQNLVYSLQNIGKYYQDSSKYLVTYLNINTDAAEFAPAFYREGIVFSSSRRNNLNLEKNFSWDKSKYLDLFETTPVIGNEMFNKPVKIKGKINSHLHEGPATFFQDDSRIIFTRNNSVNSSNGELNRLELYTAILPTGLDQWQRLEPLPFNSKNYSVGHPAMDASGAELYFVSDMPGGQGGTDIYKVLYVRGKWGIPHNLGSEINTPGNEMFPFVDENEKLYFASNGHPGLGGLDIYCVDLKSEKPTVSNVGYPINSTKDDFGLIVDHAQSIGYYSSNRTGNDDIYQFREQYETLEVIVNSNEAIDRQQTIISLKSQGFTLAAKSPDQQGKVTFEIAPNLPYEIITEAPGHLTSTTDLGQTEETLEINLKSEKPAPMEGTMLTISSPLGLSSFILTEEKVIEVKDHESQDSDVWLSGLLEENNIILADKIEINPVHYAFDQTQIESQYQLELEKLAELMKRYSFLQFELNSHTDSRGSADYNMLLSQRRAISAEQYLVNKGISKERLVVLGYGESRPLNQCVDSHPCANSEHLKNRRTEFRLIYMDKNQVVSNY